MRGRQARRQDQSLVVRMGHDHAADETGGDAPARLMNVLLRLSLSRNLVSNASAKLRAEIMGRAGLKRLLVLHHRFDAVGAKGAGELLAVALLSAPKNSPPISRRHSQLADQEILHGETVLLALGCGVLATMLASLSPVFDLRPNRPTDAAFRDRSGGNEVLPRQTAIKLALFGVGLAVLITALVPIESSLTVVGGVALAITTLCVLPCAFAIVSRALRWVGERAHSSALIVVVSELRAITTRSVALAGIAALAVYGGVAIGGARGDLVRGLDINFGEYLHSADIWVTTGGNDPGTTNSFREEGATSAIARIAGVASVRTYHGGFLDVGSRRMWIIARSPADGTPIPASQLVDGTLANATRLLRQTGWATVPDGFAREHHLRLGQPFSLPTPTGPALLRVAAVTTNLGWPPGGLIVNAEDYRRYWNGEDPTAIEVNFMSSVSAASAELAVARALSGRPGLTVQSFPERRAEYARASRQGLQALSEIATLLLVAAALAVASALSAALWQRRARLASLKIQGYDTKQLWRGAAAREHDRAGRGLRDRRGHGHLWPLARKPLAALDNRLSSAVRG